MKKTVLIVFSLLALGATAQCQTTMRQSLDGKVRNIQTEGITKVTIVSDTADYVMLTPKSRVVELIDPSGIINVRGSRITFDDVAMYYNIELHLTSGDLNISAEDKSEVILRCDADTLRMQDVEIHTEDMATVTIEPFLVARRIDFYSEDRSEIVHTKGFHADSGTEYYLGHTYEVYDNGGDSLSGNSRTEGGMVDSRADSKNLSVKSKKHRRSYDFSDRSSLQFLWGWNNWGRDNLSGFMSFDDGYELTTTFSSYQLAFTYDIVKTPDFSTFIGVGYESDVYRFSHDIVVLSPTATGEVAFADATSSATGLKKGRTKLVTRYVTLPVGVCFDINDFQIEIAAIPGLGYSSNATGLKTSATVDNGSGESTVKTVDHTISHYLTPYKLDARLSLGWDEIGVYIQPSLMPLFLTKGDNRMDREVYPIKFGFQLGF